MTTNQPETPSDRLDRLEATLTRFAELTFQSFRQHNEALNRIEAATERNAQEIFELKGAITDLNTQAQRTNRSLEALSQTQAECLQLIATNTVEINRIWQYLERQSGNGRGNGQAN